MHEYGHGLGQSITGGYVYRGTDSPSIVGAYVYADFVTGRVWALVWNGTQVVFDEQIASVSNPSSFGEDEDGELLLCSFDGRIYRLDEVDGGGAQTFPQLLSETGLFVDTAGLVPTPGMAAAPPGAPTPVPRKKTPLAGMTVPAPVARRKTGWAPRNSAHPASCGPRLGGPLLEFALSGS